MTWECGGSFLHIPLHSQEHEMWLPGFTLSSQALQALALVINPRLRLGHLIFVFSSLHLKEIFLYLKYKEDFVEWINEHE
jgi:hypothetical protein